MNLSLKYEPGPLRIGFSGLVKSIRPKYSMFGLLAEKCIFFVPELRLQEPKMTMAIIEICKAKVLIMINTPFRPAKGKKKNSACKWTLFKHENQIN